MSVKSGDKIPSVTLKNTEGELVTLDSFGGKKPLVIYFYPKDFTPGCTREACDFRDKYEDFKALGAEVIAISSDSETSHSRFIKKYNLPFIFLSDENKQARKAFGVASSLFGLIPGRETFVFNTEGRLEMRYNNLNASLHTAKAMRKLKELAGK